MSDVTPAPGTPQTATKAMVGTVLTFVTVVVSAWLADDNGASGQEVLSWVVSGLVACGLVGGAVFQVPNKAKFRARNDAR